MEKTIFVTVMSSDEWEGVSNSSREIRHPSRDQIERAIRNLDGNRRTLVTMGTGTETHMAVGGGGTCYIVYATFDNETFHNVTVPAENGQIRLVVGGQEGEYPARLCVPLPKALTAALTFAGTGELDRSLTWEKQ